MRTFLHKIKPASFFVCAAIVCEIVLLSTTPPLQSPDEFNHFYRAYQISDGYLAPQQTNKRLGGEIPYDISDFVAPFQLASRVSEYKPAFNGRSDPFAHAVSDETTFRDFPNTSYYSPVSYLPQVTALFALKCFNAPASVLYFGGRVFSFIVCLVLMYCAIRMMPMYQWLFTVLALLPMNLFVFNSFSADNSTNILSFLFIALVFKMTFDEKKVGTRQIVLLLALTCLLALAKVVYVGLVLLLFIVPAAKFVSRKQRLLCLATIFLSASVVSFLWSSLVMKNYLPYTDYNPEFRNGATLVPGANYHEQKTLILAHPGYFPGVIVRSVFNPDQTYLQGYIGQFGAYSDVQLPVWLVVLSFAVLLFIAVAEKNLFRFSVKQKIMLFLSAGFCFSLLLLSQHLTWDAVGAGRVDLIQGRYLTPLFPLLFLLPGNLLSGLSGTVKGVCLIFVVLINGAATWMLFHRYIYEPYTEVKNFTCDAETMDNYGNFRTSSFTYVQGCSNQSAAEKRNGNFSAAMSPKCSYCFTQQFKGLRKGDLIHISCWKKGEMTLCLSGGREGCAPYYNEFSKVWYTDRNGWENLHAVLEITQDCDTVNYDFFVNARGDKTGYIDDLNFVIKKKR